jgi:hypothetical protein
MVRNYDTKTTLGKVQVMQAAMAGKPLQRMYRDGQGEWFNVAITDVWDWLNNDYRIAPEPREFCLSVNPDTGLPQWVTWHRGLLGTGIRVREVLE